MAVSADNNESLVDLESSWSRLTEIKAVDQISTLLGDGFFFVDTSGEVKSRLEYLDYLSSGNLQIESCRIEQCTPRFFGDAAVVSITVGVVGNYLQRDMSGFYQITDTFVQRQGVWFATSRQETRIASRKDPLFEQVAKPDGRPRIILFVQGSFCPHCMSQVLGVVKQFMNRKYAVTVVSADTEQDLANFPNLPFRVIADPQHKLFRRFGAYADKPLHATVALDEQGTLVFSTAGDTPFIRTDIVASWLDKAATANAP